MAKAKSKKFGRYSSKAGKLAEEIASFYGEDQEQALEAMKQAIQGMRIREWVDWKKERSDLIVSYVVARPSEKTAQKYEEHQPLLDLAAYQHCLMASAFLKEADHCQQLIGSPSRVVTAFAGVHHAQINKNFFDISWPQHWGEDPFENVIEIEKANL